MKRKALFALALILFALLCLCACAGQGSDATATEPEGTVVPDTTVDGSAGETEGEPSLFSISGVYYWERDGFGGKFTITINRNGSFSYFEGALSSYIGFGEWDCQDGILTLTESGDSGRVFRFSVEERELVFLSEGSSSFIYVNVGDGDRFYLYDGSKVDDPALGDGRERVVYTYETDYSGEEIKHVYYQKKRVTITSDGDYSETVEWSVPIQGFIPHNTQPIGEGLIAFGPSVDLGTLWLARFTDEGELVWSVRRDRPAFRGEQVALLFEQSDGDLAFVTKGWIAETSGTEYRFTLYGPDGTEKSEFVIGDEPTYKMTGSYSFSRLGDGLLVKEKDGNAIRFSYFSPEGEKEWESAALDLSSEGYATAIEKNECDSPFGSRLWFAVLHVKANVEQPGSVGGEECVPARDWIHEEKLTYNTIPPARLAEYFRETNASALYAYSPETGEIECVRIFEGAISLSLSLDGDTLICDAEYPVELFYSPFTDSFTFYGTLGVTRYRFTAEGELAETVGNVSVKSYRQ